MATEKWTDGQRIYCRFGEQMTMRERAFEKAVKQIHGILDEHLAHFPVAEQKKKWDELERYLNAFAPSALPERRAK